MRLVRSLFAILAAVLVTAVAWEAQAQQTDPYVSCVRCHALPRPQARAEMVGHGSGSPPEPEAVCTGCHDTWWHGQDPNAPPTTPYFLFPAGGPGSFMKNACVGCHSAYHAAGSFAHADDVFPFYDGTPPSNPPLLVAPPTSVLPLFEFWGAPNQNPYAGGLVCSTCHDPHDPSYLVNGSPKFLRIGSFEQIAPLCGYCHDQGAPATGDDLFIPSDSDSVRFEVLPAGDLRIDVTVRNRGNAYLFSSYADAFWEDETGYRTYVGPLSVPSIPPEGEAVVAVSWMPPPGWDFGEGFFVFTFPPRPLVEGSYPVEFVRSMNVLPAPTNVRVAYATPGEIHVEWDPPFNPPDDLGWDVYRDGVKVTPTPIPYYPYGPPSFVDGGLAPETPHVYHVVAVGMGGGVPSQPSDPVGGTTSAAAAILRVPQDVPTIQQAIDVAGYGTVIQVAPGTYTERLDFANKYGVTVRGQDANGCVLDYTGSLPSGPAVDLGATAGQPGNTLAGFTIRNGWIHMDAGDVLTECVIVADTQVPPVASGGGLVAQCVFETTTQYAFHVEPGQFLTSVNSIYFGSQPFAGYPPPTDATLLLNNDFTSWYGWIDYEGSGNFSEWPLFVAPGPPQEYLPDPGSPTVGRGLALEMYDPEPPNVGAFQPWRPYTPQPPSGLAAAIVPEAPARVRLTWTASIDDPARMFEYVIYRSTSPTFPPGSPPNAYAAVPAGQFFFEDQNIISGTTYYYQVRAYAGTGQNPGTELLSAPTNTASITYVNSPPNAVDDTATTPEDQPVAVAVLANDTDLEGDLFHILDVGYPQHGSAIMNADQTIEYTPDPNFFGMDSFSYRVIDVQGGIASALVTVDVLPVNQPPVAMDDAFSIEEDLMLSFAPGGGVLLNDFDANDDALQAVLVAGPAHGTLTLNPDGSFTYFPAPDFHGTDSFTYYADDLQSVSAEATVTITVVPVNDAPRAENDAYATAEETVLTVSAAQGVLANDSEVDGDFFQPTVSSPPQHGTLQYLFSDGSFSYTPAANFSGTDSFTYRLYDGTFFSFPATVTISVSAVNDAPIAAGDSYATPEDTWLTIAAPGVLGNDADLDGDTLNAVRVSGPTNGTLTLNANGSFTYIPTTDYNGPDSFTYRAEDAQSGSDVATVSITVTAVNDTPAGITDAASTTEDTPADIPVLANDRDVEGDPLFIMSVGPAMHGTTVINGSVVTYAPAPEYSGSDSFAYSVSDGQGWSSAVVTVTVTATNDAPVAVNDPAVVAEDALWTRIVVLPNDYDVEGDLLTLISHTEPQHGTAFQFGGGAFDYLPFPNFNGFDSFTYTISDGHGATSTATVIITVTPVNDAPVASGLAVTTAEDTPASVTLSATDAEGNILTYAVGSGPAHGTLSGVAPNLTYTPDPNYAGPDGFTFTANDGLATSAPATVSLTVTPVNDPPLANDDTAATAAYLPVLITVLGNDTDIDGDALSVSSATPGANGGTAVQADGSILYTPNPGFTGTDGFSYVVGDGNGGTDTAAVTVSVRAQKLRITAVAMATVTSGRYISATAAPLAVDEAGAPLADVSVDGRWSGLTNDVDTGLTGVDGTVTMSSNQVRNARGTFTFTIDAAVKAGYELDGPASVLTDSIPYPPAPPPGGEMHVASIVMGLKTAKNTSATATVTVVDANGVPVASAAVSGSWSGAVSGTSTGTTGADGTVSLSSAGVKNAAGRTFTFTISGIAKSGWTYDPAANVETGDSITAP